MSNHKRTHDPDTTHDRVNRQRTVESVSVAAAGAAGVTRATGNTATYVSELPSTALLQDVLAAATVARTTLCASLPDVLDASVAFDAFHAITVRECAENYLSQVNTLHTLVSRIYTDTAFKTNELRVLLRERRPRGDPLRPSTNPRACWSGLPTVLQQLVMQFAVDAIDVVHLGQTNHAAFAAASAAHVLNRCMNPIQVVARPALRIPPASRWNLSRRMPLAISWSPNGGTVLFPSDVMALQTSISDQQLHITHLRVYGLILDKNGAIGLFAHVALQGLVELNLGVNGRSFPQPELTEAPLLRAATERFLKGVYPPMEARFFASGPADINIKVDFSTKVRTNIIGAPLEDTSSVAVRCRPYAMKRELRGNRWFTRQSGNGTWVETPFDPAVRTLKLGTTSMTDTFERRACYVLWWEHRHQILWRM